MIGKPIQEILPANVATEASQCLQQAFSTQEVQIFEYQMPLNQKVHDYEARIVVSVEDEVIALCERHY